MRRLLYFALVLIAATSFAQQPPGLGYIFYTDFEEAGMDAWNLYPGSFNAPSTYIGLQPCYSGSGATLGVTTPNSALPSYSSAAIVHSGNYSLVNNVSGGSNCVITSQWTTSDPIHTRLYFYLSSGFSIPGSGTIQIESLATSGYAALSFVNLTNTGTTGSPVYKLNTTCGGTGTHAITTGAWHSVEWAFSVGAETSTILLDGSTEISGTSCSNPTPVVYLQIGVNGTATGSIYFDDVVVSSSVIGSPATNIVLRHSPSTFGRTALPMMLTMWGTTAGDTVAVSMDGTQEATYSNATNAMNVQFTCCTRYSAGSHTLLVQEKTGSTVNASWTETMNTFGSPTSGSMLLDAYNNLSVSGSGVFPIMPWYASPPTSCSSQADIGFWVRTACGGPYNTLYGWVDPVGSPSTSQLISDLSTIQSGSGVTALVPDGGFWAGYNGTPVPTAQEEGICNYAAALASNTNMFGWTWMDEPDYNQINGVSITPTELNKWTNITHGLNTGSSCSTSGDPNHLVWINTTGTNATQKFVNGWFYPNYIADVLSMDNYPIATYCGATGETVATWLTYVDQFQRLNYNLVPFNFILEGGPVVGATSCAPSGSQVRMESWLATIHGAKSITYFDGSITTATSAQLAAQNAFLTLSQTPSVLAALTSPANSLTVTTDQTAVGARVDAMVKQVGSTVTVFGQRLTDCVSGGGGSPCVPETDSALSTTFTVSGSGCPFTGTATVVGESRTIPVSSCQITDTFNAYDTHVYQFTLNQAQVPPPTGLTAAVN